jgi:hypothetical protein
MGKADGCTGCIKETACLKVICTGYIREEAQDEV